MKILVTGGNGFVGSHLCESLLTEGFEVTSLDVKFDSNSDSFDCKKVRLDISNGPSLRDEIKNHDLVIHLAAISRVDDAQSDPERCFNVNVIGVLKIVEAIKNSNVKLIFSSSREVYGEPEKVPVKESDPKNPLTVYGTSKLSAEQLLRTYRKLYGLDYVTLRLANVFGSPKDLPQRVIPSFIEQATKGSPFNINGGNQVIDFTFIDDVVQGIKNVVKKIEVNEKDCFGKEYNFASASGISVKELAKLIKKIFNSNSELIFNEERTYDVQNFIGDYTKAKLAFSFEPKHSLSEGLEKYKKTRIFTSYS